MNRTDKGQVVEGLRERLTRTPHLYLTDFTGVSVKKITELRRKLRSAGTEYVVVKNTLAVWAFREAEVGGLDEVLAGPTALALAQEPVAAAKILAEFQREFDTFRVKAGLVDGRPVTPDEVRRLATLPSREELLGQLAGTMQAPLQGFLGAMNGLMLQWIGALEALKAQRADAG